MNLSTTISLMIPGGQLTHHVDIVMATVNVASLMLTIKVIGYDADGNERIVINVPHQLTALREIPADELTQIVETYFHQINEDEQ